MDVPAFLAELDRWTAELEWPVETHRYGSHPEQEADLRLPEGEGPHPTIVLVHGGFWRARFGRSSTAALAVDLARRGWATWNVEYRRVGCDGGIPETLDDVSRAVATLYEVDARIDRSRVVAIGHSAGGHLALWIAGTGRVNAVVTLAGVCDLVGAARAGLGEGAAVEFAGGTPEERPDAYEVADPSQRVPIGVPQLLVHGVADDRVPPDQSRRYARAAREAGDPCELLELEGVGHFEVIDPRTAVWAKVAARLDTLAA